MGTSFIPKLVYGDTPVTVLFNYPPSVDDGDQYLTDANISTSLAGVRQVSVNHVEITRSVTLAFLNPAQVDALQAFYDNWAFAGKPFTWYEHQEDTASAVTYELSDLAFPPLRKIPMGTFFLQELTLTFRRFT